ncbi:hypothetical protein TNCV_843381 [Trichonephila clavipes]|nr:hypothetical protein TNCV_843381 [Trichonephila clavipes]
MHVKRPPIGMVVRRGGCQLTCRPHHLTTAQSYVAKSPRAAEQCDANIHSLTRNVELVVFAFGSQLNLLVDKSGNSMWKESPNQEIVNPDDPDQDNGTKL